MPSDVKVSYEFDQSPYVTRAIRGLAVEGAFGAMLTGLMILVFLRDWRSALIVVINIPLAMLAACSLWVTKQTVNIMTLGGLALAVGILVDEATVCIENIHIPSDEGQLAETGRREGTTETTVPRFLAMLCILAMFVPTLFMAGARRRFSAAVAGGRFLDDRLISAVDHPGADPVGLVAARPRTPSGLRPAIAVSRGCKGLTLPGRRKVVRLAGWWWRVYLAVATLVIGFVGPIGQPKFSQSRCGPTPGAAARARRYSGSNRTEAVALQAWTSSRPKSGPKRRDYLGVCGRTCPELSHQPDLSVERGFGRRGHQVQLKPSVRSPSATFEDASASIHRANARRGFSFEPSDIVSRVMSLGRRRPSKWRSAAHPGGRPRICSKNKVQARQIPALRDVQFGQALDYPTVDVVVNASVLA